MDTLIEPIGSRGKVLIACIDLTACIGEDGNAIYHKENCIETLETFVVNEENFAKYFAEYFKKILFAKLRNKDQVSDETCQDAGLSLPQLNSALDNSLFYYLISNFYNSPAWAAMEDLYGWWLNQRVLIGQKLTKNLKHELKKKKKLFLNFK